jgi:glycosyltransferase involved in cell wall biosynthesis
MLLAIHFARLGPYHLARLRSACEVLMPLGWRVLAFEIAGSDATYEWARSSAGEGGCERVTVFPDGVFEKIPPSEMRRGVVRELDRLRPDAVAIAGWGTADARACLAWCQKHQAKAIVMSETRAADGRRVWWKEWVKSRIVRRFDAALCGGGSHKRYLVQLGMPEERIAYGYNIVDNEFFAKAKKSGLQEHGTMGLQEGGIESGTTKDANLHEWGAGSREIEGEAGLTTEDTTERLGGHKDEQAEFGSKGEGAGATESKCIEVEARSRLSGQAGAAFSNPLTSEPAGDCENSLLNRSAIAADSLCVTRNSLPATVPEALAGPYFLASNRFVERKNLERLIEAYARHVATSRNSGLGFQRKEKRGVWHLVLLGDGELKGELMSLCEELGVHVFSGAERENLKLNSYKLKTPSEGGLVVFAGFRQIAELPAFYAGAGAFVHPALEEPWGLVINEAMASGLPVLSSRNVGAAEELVVDGETGYLFDPMNIEEMADAMAKVEKLMPEARSRMGRAAREIVERKVPTLAFGEGLAKGLCC